MMDKEILERTIEILEKSNDLWRLANYDLVERAAEIIFKLKQPQKEAQK